MARIRQQNELVLSLLDFLKTAQPKLDTKPGTVSRDLCVDGFALQLSKLYEELQRISTLQSLRLSLGADLDRLASNYGIIRKQATKASGPVLLTFSTIPSNISINRGDSVSGRNGATFIIQSNLVVSVSLANTYRATASQFRADLDEIGNTDEYAVEVTVEASAPGVQGNIDKYGITGVSIAGVDNATNVVSFSGGSGAESDAAFRSRILAVFSGSNTGTALGYKNATLEDPSVLDAVVIQPGDTLMTRDGTQIGTDSSGNKVILSEGTGGKVDIYVFGQRLKEVIDSEIYTDQSNTNDPTDTSNDFVLGVTDSDLELTLNARRLTSLTTGILPSQPVANILQVSGSISGGNFVEKSIDSLGRVSGNYELIKDSGEYGGSPWGFDRLRWVDDRIRDLPEDITKGPFNGQDSFAFSDITEINKCQQRINVSNENSQVLKSNRSLLQLSHKPIINVTRVFNSTTGERYVIASQNPDGTGSINYTGRIRISGSSLPAVSDTLEVDYTWLYDYDPNFDFDNKSTSKNPRSVSDSIDWGYSNSVTREEAILIDDGYRLSINTIHPISSIIDVNVVEIEGETTPLEVEPSPLDANRPSVEVANIIANIVSVIRVEFADGSTGDGADVWNTSKGDGSFSGKVLFLPTDGLANIGDKVVVTYNAIDIYNEDGYQGSFNNNTITIVPSDTAVAGIPVEINYISNIFNLLPSTQLSNLPIVRNLNAFDSESSEEIGCQPTTHIYDSNNVIISNIRQAPSNLSMNISGSISPGVITVSGSTIYGVFDAVFPVAFDGLKIDVSSALKNELGILSSKSIPSNLQISRITKVEKVTTTSNLDVLSSDFTYDILGYQINDNRFIKDESVQNTSLSSTEFILPATNVNEENAPSVGDRLRVTFYYTIDNDSENVRFSKSGTLVTNKKFALVDVISISSGFTSSSSSSATLTINNFNQPTSGARYKAFYDYIAPKQNERITVRYNLNKLIADATLNVERTRPVNADVLVKEAESILVDIIVNIVVTSDYSNNADVVLQNVRDAITSALNATQLGTIIDSSDLIAIAQGIDGVDRTKVVYFNKTGVLGSVLSISAEKNQYLTANNVTVNQEER